MSRINLRRTQRGFVLALTVMILAAILAVASAFALKTSQVLEVAQKNKLYAEAMLGFHDAQAEVTITLAVLPRGRYGIGQLGGAHIVPDGRFYQAESGSFVQMQDARGLTNLNSMPVDWFRRYLGGRGILPLEAEALLDVLLDYRDADSMRRLNGAEVNDYVAFGYLPPRNNLLLTPKELYGMPLWRDYLQRARLNDTEFTTAVGSGINPNTASWEVLASIPGISADSAKVLVQLRRQGATLGLIELVQAGGEAGNALDSAISPIPSPTTLVTHWMQGLGLGKKYSFTITPNSDYGPWRVDYIDQVTLQAELPAKDGRVPLPRMEDVLRGGLQAAQSNSPIVPGGGGGVAPGAQLR